jgi:acetoin utilization deacetylase AcuC-like enzyme
MHRFPFYPGSGESSEVGTGVGLGTTANVPIHFGMGRAEQMDAFRLASERLAKKMRPELIIISAGFDSHRLDPVGSLDLESEDFVELTRIVMSIAQVHCQGRVVSLLEGGYHPDALADSVCLHLETLLDSKSSAISDSGS